MSILQTNFESDFVVNATAAERPTVNNRIWIPLYNKVIITKDIHFNKEKVFNGNTKILKYKIKNIFLKYLVKIIKNTTRKAIIIILLTTYNNTAKDLKWSYKIKGNKEKI